MMDYENKITGYHCNYKSRLECFITKNEICISLDTHYLGDGMYFWNNQYDLRFWEAKKKAQAKGAGIEEPILCVTAKIGYDTCQLLDLTVKEEFEKLIRIRDIVNNAHRSKKDVFENYALGEVINKLFRAEGTFGAYFSEIKVIKVNLRYENISEGYIIGAKDYSERLHPNQSFSFDVRTIHCVKDGANLSFCEIIKEEVAS